MIALFLLLVIVAIVLGIVGVVEKGRRDGGRAGCAAIRNGAYHRRALPAVRAATSLPESAAQPQR